jgi:FkbH-like protein
MQEVGVPYNLLVRNLKRNTEGLKAVKVAVLADFASQHFAKALKSALVENKLNADIWEAEYNAVESTIVNGGSELYQQHYQYIIIVPSVQKLHKEFLHAHSAGDFADVVITRISGFIKTLSDHSTARIVYTNFPALNDGIFGNFANKTEQSFLFQLRKINVELMRLGIAHSNFFISDAEELFSRWGQARAFDPRLYVHADIIFSLDFLAALAINTASIIAAIQGEVKKCVVCDLDNTLWGGIIGDDGIENIQIGNLGIGKAFSGLQQWLLALKERGIILAVCSKNNDSVAREVFERHPEMILRLRDIAVFVANWETKVDNIRFIKSVLNIGFDSMVFLDDNPFERDIVRQNIGGIVVPELPEDPSEYVYYLQSLNLFETASFSQNDAQRTQQYQEEASRHELQKTFANEDEFLKSLDMKATVKPVDIFNCPRVAQLSQRSNQFNLRTVRYTDDDIKRLMVDPGFITITISLSDKYGDYGLISAVILEKRSAEVLFIDTWIMSCRVLKRGVESLVLNEICALAKDGGFRSVVGEYVPTKKNSLVSGHYVGLGFEALATEGQYRLDVNSYQERQNFIQKTLIYANS